MTALHPKNCGLLLRNKNVTTVELPHYCGTIHNEPQEKADILNKFFASVFTKDDSSLPEIESDPIPNMASIKIHTDGVLHLLLN